MLCRNDSTSVWWVSLLVFPLGHYYYYSIHCLYVYSQQCFSVNTRQEHITIGSKMYKVTHSLAAENRLVEYTLLLKYFQQALDPSWRWRNGTTGTWLSHVSWTWKWTVRHLLAGFCTYEAAACWLSSYLLLAFIDLSLVWISHTVFATYSNNMLYSAFGRCISYCWHQLTKHD